MLLGIGPSHTLRLVPWETQREAVPGPLGSRPRVWVPPLCLAPVLKVLELSFFQPVLEETDSLPGSAVGGGVQVACCPLCPDPGGLCGPACLWFPPAHPCASLAQQAACVCGSSASGPALPSSPGPSQCPVEGTRPRGPRALWDKLWRAVCLGGMQGRTKRDTWCVLWGPRCSLRLRLGPVRGWDGRWTLGGRLLPLLQASSWGHRPVSCCHRQCCAGRLSETVSGTHVGLFWDGHSWAGSIGLPPLLAVLLQGSHAWCAATVLLDSRPRVSSSVTWG